MNTAVGIFFILSTIAFLIVFVIYFLKYKNYKCPASTPSSCPKATPSSCPKATPSSCPKATPTPCPACPIKNRLGPTFNPSSDQLINDIINFTNIGIDSFKPQICQFVTDMEKNAIDTAPDMTAAQAKAELDTASSQVPEAIRAQYVEIGNRLILATTTDDNLDKTKLVEIAKKIKEMFCSGI